MSQSLSSFAQALLGLAMLGVFALLGGGVILFRRGDRQKGLLMGGVALVVFANVLIWAL